MECWPKRSKITSEWLIYMETILEIVRIEQIICEAAESINYTIKDPKDGAEIASRFIGHDDCEVFFVICLNIKNHVVVVHRCYVGSLNASIVHPLVVFKSAIMSNIASVIFAHQNPSGGIILYHRWRISI